MESIDWNDVNVLKKLPDGWYSVFSDLEYGKLISKDPDIKYNDSVEKANKRHELILKKEKESLRDRSKTCSHENYPYKGSNPVGSGGRVCTSKRKDKRDNMSEMCDKAKDIFPNIIRNLSHDQVTIDDSSDELMRVFRTYVLTNDDRGRRRFRVSASPKGLCAALLWRKILLRKISMTMLEFSKRTKVDRMTISTCFARLDDYKDLHVSKRGRPKRK